MLVPYVVNFPFWILMAKVEGVKKLKYLFALCNQGTRPRKENRRVAFKSSLIGKENNSTTWPKEKHSSNETSEQFAAIQISSFKYFIKRTEVLFH